MGKAVREAQLRGTFVEPEDVYNAGRRRRRTDEIATKLLLEMQQDGVVEVEDEAGHEPEEESLTELGMQQGRWGTHGVVGRLDLLGRLDLRDRAALNKVARNQAARFEPRVVIRRPKRPTVMAPRHMVVVATVDDQQAVLDVAATTGIPAVIFPDATNPCRVGLVR